RLIKREETLQQTSQLSEDYLIITCKKVVQDLGRNKLKGIICIVLLAITITLPAVPKFSSSHDLCLWSSGFTTPLNNQVTSGIQAVPLPILSQPVLRTPLRAWRLQQTIQDSRVGHISDY